MSFLAIQFNIPPRIGIPQYFKNLWNWNVKISKTKNFDFEITYHSLTIIEFEFDISLGGRDHAGIDLFIGLFGLGLHLGIPDSRHWNYEFERWETEEEAKIWSEKNISNL